MSQKTPETRDANLHLWARSGPEPSDFQLSLCGAHETLDTVDTSAGPLRPLCVSCLLRVYNYEVLVANLLLHDETYPSQDASSVRWQYRDGRKGEALRSWRQMFPHAISNFEDAPLPLSRIAYSKGDDK